MIVKKTSIKYGVLLTFSLVVLVGLILRYHNPDNIAKSARADHVQKTDTVPKAPLVFGNLNLQTYDTVQVKISKRKLLGQLLEPFGVSYATINQLADLPDSIFNEKRLAPRDMMVFFFAKDNPEHIPAGLIYSKDKEHYSRIFFGESLTYGKEVFPREFRKKSLASKIQSSLYQTVINAGGSRDLVVKLEEVFAWTLDFYHVRKGDYLKVLFEEKWINGEFRGISKIQSAVFHHRGDSFFAFAYDQGKGLSYYDEKGNSLQKAFLRAPLKYSRISSRFSYNRLHPVLRIRRPHLGVDYAAPRGTPVYAVGDGEITKKGYGRGNGNYVKIKHNATYETMYLHLSRFGRNIAHGARVKQGQIIGYVGSTGISTGPHLDYRVFRNGQAVNPLRLKIPPSHPIDSVYRPEYLRQMEVEKRQLQQLLLP